MSRSATLPADASSPKPRSKFQRFWDRDRSNKEHKPSSIPATTTAIAASVVAVQTGASSSSSASNSTSRSASEPSIFKRLRGGGGNASSGSGSSSSSNSKGLNGISGSPEPDLSTMERDASDMEARLDERLKRKAFAHHDCQSMSVNLGYAARLRGLLAQRRNTTTGASAASMASASSSSASYNSSSAMAHSSSLAAAASTGSSGSLSSSGKGKLKTQMSFPPPAEVALDAVPPTAPVDEVDTGDGKSNQLLHSCPFFRNELGGEPEWCVGVSRCSSPQLQQPQQQHPSPTLLHRPISTYGVSVLEFPPGKSHWRHGICPYQKQPSVLERGDQGAFYYGNHFYAQEHQNWFGKF